MGEGNEENFENVEKEENVEVQDSQNKELQYLMLIEDLIHM